MFEKKKSIWSCRTLQFILSITNVSKSNKTINSVDCILKYQIETVSEKLTEVSIDMSWDFHWYINSDKFISSIGNIDLFSDFRILSSYLIQNRFDSWSDLLVSAGSSAYVSLIVIDNTFHTPIFNSTIIFGSGGHFNKTLVSDLYQRVKESEVYQWIKFHFIFHLKICCQVTIKQNWMTSLICSFECFTFHYKTCLFHIHMKP